MALGQEKIFSDKEQMALAIGKISFLPKNGG
jgi:hypothetical protein